MVLLYVHHTSTQNHFTASTLLNESKEIMTSLLQFVNLFRVSPEEVTLSLSVSDFSFVGDYCLANFGEAWRDEFLYVHRKKYYETAAIFP
jgi:hypothetical protein